MLKNSQVKSHRVIIKHTVIQQNTRVEMIFASVEPVIG